MSVSLIQDQIVPDACVAASPVGISGERYRAGQGKQLIPMSPPCTNPPSSHGPSVWGSGAMGLEMPPDSDGQSPMQLGPEFATALVSWI